MVAHGRPLAGALVLVWWTGASARGWSPGPPAPLRVDVYGDPLPVGARARLGTVRLRHAGAVRDLTFAPDGRAVVSASVDGSIRLWDAATGKELCCFRGPAGKPGDGVNSVAFSPDGSTLAAGGAGGTVW